MLLETLPNKIQLSLDGYALAVHCTAKSPSEENLHIEHERLKILVRDINEAITNRNR